MRKTAKDERDWKAGGRKANRTLDREHPKRESETPAHHMKMAQHHMKMAVQTAKDRRDDARGGRKANYEEGHRKTR